MMIQLIERGNIRQREEMRDTTKKKKWKKNPIGRGLWADC